MKTSHSFFAGLVAFSLSSCQAPTPPGVVEGEPAFSNVALTQQRMDIVLRDIPLPKLFTMLPESFCHGTESFRYGELSYIGVVPLDDVFDFFKKQMLFNRWTEGSVRKFDSNARMAYSKNGETCTILIRENIDHTELKIIVEQKKS